MATMKTRTGPGSRLEAGAKILMAAGAVDTRLIKGRLGTFKQVHGTYMDAQRKMELAEAQLRAAQQQLAECDVAQDAAVETLARALVTDGQPRTNPFAAFGAAAPSTIMRLAVGEESKAVRRLVEAVRQNDASKASGQAAAAADKAARAVDAALLPVGKLEAAARNARRARDELGQNWETALAAGTQRLITRRPSV